MLAEYLRAPIRPKGIKPYLEALVAIAVLGVCNGVFMPESPGLLGTTPHPLVFVVILVAGRYGLLPGLVTALISIVSLSAICYRYFLVPDISALIHEGSGVPLMSLLTMAVFVGELRDFTLRRYQLVVDEHDLVEERFDKLASAYTVLQDDKYLLEKAILSDRTPLEFTSALVENLDTLDDREFNRTVVDLMKNIGCSGGVALYLLGEKKDWKLATTLGEEFSPVLALEDPVTQRALSTHQVATVNDLPDVALDTMAGSMMQVMVPLPHMDEGKLHGLVVLKDVPLATFSRMRLKALEVAGRLAGRMASRIELHRRTQDRNVLDPRIDASTPFYLQKRGREELGRCLDRNLPFSAVVIRIPEYDAVQAEMETILLATLADVLGHCLRTGQVLGRAPQPGVFVVLMPLDGMDVAQAFTSQVQEEISAFQMRPYDGDQVLQLQVDPLSLHPGVGSWEEAEKLLYPGNTEAEA